MINRLHTRNGKKAVVHFMISIFSFTIDAKELIAACGEENLKEASSDPDRVTCKACKRTEVYKSVIRKQRR